MTRTWAVCKREFAGYFNTPVGYVVLATYALIAGIGFTASFIFYGAMTTSPSNYGFSVVPDFEETFFSPFIVYSATIVMFIGPLITMRLLAEERNKGTEELLFTHPLRDRDIVFGKYFASLGLLLVLMGVITVHVLIVNFFVDVEPAVLAFGLITLFLLGAAFLSLGLFVSSICRSQITAAAATFGAFFVMYLLGNIANEFSGTSPIPAGWPESIRAPLESGYQIVRAFIIELPLDRHAKQMAQGVVLISDVVYYVLFISFFLFLTFRALERRRWSA